MILQLENVTKKYGEYTAAADISLTIPRGEIVGLLGPNGAGKTTLIRMITRIIYPDSGAVFFAEKKMNDRNTQQIGYMPEERGLYKGMTVWDQLIYLAQLKDLSKKAAIEKTSYWLEKFGIADWKNKKIEDLSKGMAQKVQFIATVIHDPDLLILDEPFSGLDPINAKIIEDEIKALAAAGKSIIFSTHRMEQVEDICRHIILINQGKKIVDGEIDQLKKQYKEGKWIVKFSEKPEHFTMHDTTIQAIDATTFAVYHANNNNEILKACIAQNLPVASFEEALPTLNELFIKAINSNS